MPRRPLPPYGRQFVSRGGYAWVAFGPGAWDMAAAKVFPVMVLPEGEEPGRYRWPVKGHDVTGIEAGTFDTARLHSLALALLLDGAAMVRVLRCALLAERGTWPMATFTREGRP